MNSVSDYVGPVLVFLGVTAVISFVSWRRLRSGWQGVVEDKIHLPGDADGASEQCYVVYRTDAGKRVKISVAGKAGLDAYVVGQRVVKHPGQSWPVPLP